MDFKELATRMDDGVTAEEAEEFADSQYMHYLAVCVSEKVPFSKVITKEQFFDAVILQYTATCVHEETEQMMLLASAAVADLYGDTPHDLAEKIRKRMGDDNGREKDV